jgi:hypothetical protein
VAGAGVFLRLFGMGFSAGMAAYVAIITLWTFSNMEHRILWGPHEARDYVFLGLLHHHVGGRLFADLEPHHPNAPVR